MGKKKVHSFTLEFTLSVIHSVDLHMNNNMYPLLEYHTEYFSLLLKLLCPTYSSLLLQPLESLIFPLSS